MRWHFVAVYTSNTKCGKRAARRWHVTTYQEWMELAARRAAMCGVCTTAIQDETNVPEHLRQWARVH